MRPLTKLQLRLRSLLRRREVDLELDAELREHLERLVEHYAATGLSPAEARHAAMREMGPLEQQKAECRDARGLALLDSVYRDVRYALRALGRAPGFTAVAVLSLAIGIGANTTIFSFVNAVLLEPLPYPGADRIAILHEQAADDPALLSVHPVSFMEWRVRTRAFDALALVQTPPLNVMTSSGAEQIVRMSTTAELFDVFGVRPVLGRGFTDEETRPNGGDVVILGHGFWRRWFGGDSDVVGRQLPVQDGALTIVGVAPAGFRIGSIEPDAFTPLVIDPANPAATGSRAFHAYGRLADVIGLAAARAEMTVVAEAIAQTRSGNVTRVSVSSLHEHLVQDARPGLRLLAGVVAMVLAIACVNLAGLLMVRGIGRRGEFAVRMALGASRGRVVRQLLIEGFVLSLCGAVVGLVLAAWATQTLVTLSAGTLTAGSPVPVRLDAACLLFTLGVSVVTTMALGLAPARQVSHVEPQGALRARGATSDRRQQRVSGALVVVQVALAVVLTVGAGLLLRTLSSLSHVDLGFRPTGAVTMGLFLGLRPPETRVTLLDEILDRVEGLQGVNAAGTIQFLPLSGMTCGTGFWMEEHAGERDPSRTLSTECALVGRGYFDAMGIAVREGRPFERRDTVASPRVLVVNRTFAARYFPDGSALGRRMLVQSSNQEAAEVVGVVDDVRHNGLTFDPAPTVFLLHAQTPGYITNLVVRTDGDPLSHAAAIVRAIHEVDATQAVSGVRTLDADVAKVLARPRLHAVLVTSFAIIAVMLAAFGLYGVLAYVVGQRTRDIGVRLALGAAPARIFRSVLLQGMALVAAGLVLGLLTTLGLRHVVSALLFGVAPADPLTYLIATLALVAAATVALVVPARRAARVAPVTVLRGE